MKSTRILLATIFCVAIMSATGLAANCKSRQSGPWSLGTTWDCGHAPTAADNVTIAPGHAVTLTAPATCHNLTIQTDAQSSGTLDLANNQFTLDGSATAAALSNSGTVFSGGGAFQTLGSVSLTKTGAFGAPLVVLTGTTTGNGGQVLGAALIVKPGAIFRVSASETFTVDGDVTVSSGGTLSGGGNIASVLVFGGLTFSNDGLVSVASVNFNRTGQQTIKGMGGWTEPGTITMGGDGRKVLASNTSFAKKTLIVGDNTTFDIGAFVLTFNAGTINKGTVTGTGKVVTQGSVTLNTTSNFTALLEVNSGTTTGTNLRALGGALIIDSGAAFQVAASKSFTVNGDVTVSSGGTLGGGGNIASDLVFDGSKFINDGLVSIASVNFNRAGQQSIKGTGSWTEPGTITMGGSDRKFLASNAGFAEKTLTVGDNATFDIGAFTLTFNVGTINKGAVTGTGRVLTQGGVTLNTTSNFTATLEVSSGTTTGNHLKVLGGALIIDSGAAFQVSASHSFTVNGDVTISSGATLGGGGNIASDLVFGGLKFINDGIVSVASVTFNRIRQQGTTGEQSISGAGSWTEPGTITMGGTDRKSLASNTSFAKKTLTVDDNASFQIGPFTLTFNGGTINTGTIAGTGRVLTQGAVTLNTNSNFSAALEVNSGTTTGNDQKVLGGRLIIDSGATFQVAASKSFTVNGDVTVNSGGSLAGGGNIASTFISGGGSTFINDGMVRVAKVQFGEGSHTLSGTGSFSSNTAMVRDNGTLTLGSDHQMSTVVVNGGSAMNISSRTLLLSGDGAALTNGGTLNTIGSTVVYNGDEPQTVAAANVTYNNLTIDNLDGVKLNGATSVFGTLTLTQGTFTIGSNLLTLGNGATISRSSGRISAAPIFGLTVNVVYTGTGPTTTEMEIPTATPVLNNLTINVSDSVLLNGNATVNGVLALTSGVFNNGSGLALANGATISRSNGRLNATPAFSAKVNVEYVGSSSAITSGPELPVSASTLNNLTIDTSSGASLNTDATANGVLALSSGVFDIGSHLKLANGATISRSGGSLSGTPAFGATVNVVYTGTAAITTGSEIPTDTSVLNNLTINDSGNVVLNADATVNGVLALTSGDLRTGAFTLTMPGNASSAGTTDVIGSVRRTGFVEGIPLSFGNPFNTIRFNSAIIPTEVTMHLVKASPVNFGESVRRTYTIDPTGRKEFSATLRLHYRDSELNGNTESALKLWRGLLRSWVERIPTAADTTDNWLEINGVTGFAISPWTISASGPSNAQAIK